MPRPKVYRVLGTHLRTGSSFEIEFRDPKHFSNAGLREILLTPDDGTGHSSKSATATVIRNNQGATDFFDWLRTNFSLAADDVEKDLDELFVKLYMQFRKHNKR